MIPSSILNFEAAPAVFLASYARNPKKPLSASIIRNIVASLVYVFCFHQYRGKAEK